jgi:all-trans-retinol 13,14-reductase
MLRNTAGLRESGMESKSSAGQRYDAIVIGSGMGALTCASLLAGLRHLRVLVLERHYRLGGFTHSFARPGGRHWDVGLHYVGQMAQGEPTRGLMNLVTGGRVQWQMMPSPFERYVYPDLRIDQPVGRDAYVEVLVSRWPQERAGILRYFRIIQATARWLAPYLLSSGGPVWQRWPADLVRRLGEARALTTTKQILDDCVRAPELKAVLASQWGDYGLPPGRSAFIVHAMIVSHYLEGGWFPVGGASGIAQGAKAVIESAGGTCLTGEDVETVLMEGGRAIGVRSVHGQGHQQRREFRAPLVISNAGARLTYERLLPADSGTAVNRIRHDLRQLPDETSAVQLFLGLRESPETIGFHGENHWIFDDYDHDTIFNRRNALLDGQAAMAYLSLPSLKDPTADRHAAEVIAFVDHSEFTRWQSRQWKQRGTDYETLKDRISQTLLEFIGRQYPELPALVNYQELGTPLTTEHFTAHHKGAIYGLPAVPSRYRLRWLGTRTPVQGLLLTGSDVCGHGIVGAMMGGVGTAAHVMGGMGFMQIMRRAWENA